MYGISKELLGELIGAGAIPSLDEMRMHGTNALTLTEEQQYYETLLSAYNSNAEIYDYWVSKINLDGVILLLVDDQPIERAVRAFGCTYILIDGITIPLADGRCVVLISTDDKGIAALHHELIHVRQIRDGRLIMAAESYLWDGVAYDYDLASDNVDEYMAVPWEVEAFCVSGDATDEQIEAYKNVTPTSNIAFSDLIKG